MTVSLSKQTLAAVLFFAAGTFGLQAGKLENFSGLGLAPNSYTDPAALETTGTFSDDYDDRMMMELYTGSTKHGGLTMGTAYSTGKWTMPGMEDWNMAPSWAGFVASSMTATTAGGLPNQYNAITGTGYGGSDNYFVFYGDIANLGIAPITGIDTIALQSGSAIEGLWLTNTNFAYYSMLNGDSYQSPFTDGDYYKLIITGYDDSMTVIGSMDFYMAQGTDILKDWGYADILNGIGDGVTMLTFGFEATGGAKPPSKDFDVPGYFALGGVVLADIPEPACATVVMLLGTLIFAARSRRG